MKLSTPRPCIKKSADESSRGSLLNALRCRGGGSLLYALRSRDGSSHIHSARGLFFGSTCFKFIMALVSRGAVPSAFLTLTSTSLNCFSASSRNCLSAWALASRIACLDCAPGPPTNSSNSRLAIPKTMPRPCSASQNTTLSELILASSSSVMSSALIRTVTVFATSSLCFPLLNRKVATSVIKGVHLSALHSPASLTRTFVFTSLSPLLLPAACTIFAAFFTAFTAFISHSSTLRPHQSAASVVDCRPETSPFHVASV
mmetsp:Transcript_18590/g.32957  ORF Transcript_18590/g.32957 Transcript_18590/m.32957 type:complete len:259 (-) Transcript_18590:178-954(-)